MNKYTAEDARREVREIIREGYNFSYIRIFLHDLARGKDISWEECGEIMREIAEGKFDSLTDYSISTF